MTIGAKIERTLRLERYFSGELDIGFAAFQVRALDGDDVIGESCDDRSNVLQRVRNRESRLRRGRDRELRNTQLGTQCFGLDCGTADAKLAFKRSREPVSRRGLRRRNP